MTGEGPSQALALPDTEEDTKCECGCIYITCVECRDSFECPDCMRWPTAGDGDVCLKCATNARAKEDEYAAINGRIADDKDRFRRIHQLAGEASKMPLVFEARCAVLLIERYASEGLRR